MLPILPKIEPTIQVIEKKVPVKVITKHITAAPHTEKKKNIEKIIGPFLPKILVFFGVLLILSQILPLTWSLITGYSLTSNSSIFLPVPESFMQKLSAVNYVDPGTAWFEAVVAQNHTSKIDTEYKKTMKITIEKSGITRVNLAANIPGNNAAIYDKALKHGVAHLKGTAVPGDEGLSVIYGHSGVAGFFAGRSSPQIVFSRLDTVSIGDTMTIERDGKELRYIISGKKIIEAQDLSFMSEQTDKERAVLLTCWPLGIGTKRLIVIADRI
ncbi:sortase [bacterium]|nr:sortase [bacterium]